MKDAKVGQGGKFEPLRALMGSAIREGAFPGAAWGVAQGGRVLVLEAKGGFTYKAEGGFTYDPKVGLTPGTRAGFTYKADGEDTEGGLSSWADPILGAPGELNRATTIPMPVPRPVSLDTSYDLASVSKVVATTAAAMLLYQRGLIELDAPLGDLLPGFVIASECGSGRHRVTLRMLLAHASGLPGYAPLFLEHQDAPSLLRACLQMPLTAGPGARAEYSDIGFILLGKALEVIAGESLDRFCTREIFKPLGMDSTRYNPRPEERPAIPPTELDELFRRQVVQGVVHDENCWVLGGCAGHAGLFAPVEDLLRFADAMLAPLRENPVEVPPLAYRASPSGGLAPTAQPFPVAPTQLFTAETVALFTARAELPTGSSRALGWDTPSEDSSSGRHFSSRSAGHLGYTGTSLWLDMERDLAVVLLTNRTWPTRENKRIQQVRPAFHNLVSELL